ncbi:mannan endo-1,4-beta-mannosidase 4 [Dorcoceras hygrometricum]|uniref:Mannan endo-1,4-beta-mannosidase 4 n=1 Tax=Dorcoceras hygrometricum TaxID=472368 RepID=A0A2Z7B142_9LAMI|nr:mannan endo-1,4-beta-mannosidase 4 [Dorcoceras hygrometricum]
MDQHCLYQVEEDFKLVNQIGKVEEQFKRRIKQREEESFERLEEATSSNKTSSVQNRIDEQAGKLVKDKPAQMAWQIPSNPRERRFEYNTLRQTLFSIQIDLLVLSSQYSAHVSKSKEKLAMYLLTKDAKCNSVRRPFNVYYFMSNGQISTPGYKA